MKVLIGCEFSYTVGREFTKLGHEVTTCDLLGSPESPRHHQGDLLDILNDGWDLAVFHPPCTYLCSSGLHHNKGNAERRKQTEAALKFVSDLLGAPIDRIALENPIGCISSRIRKPEQIIQPYQHGADASKSTCLWLKNLPPVQWTEMVKPRLVATAGKWYMRWANQTDSGQNSLPPSDDRWAQRSLTYPGIAKAMAATWGTQT